MKASKEKQESRFMENIQVCLNWSAVRRTFDSFPKPVWSRDVEGEYQNAWVFRGHRSSSFQLEPTIERDYGSFNWPEVEHKALREFQSKARLHIDPVRLPDIGDAHKLSWLAVMQHYGAPTRLLDFTYSPYLALYFALRSRSIQTRGYAEVWAIDATALQTQSEKTARDADIKSQESDAQYWNFGHGKLFQMEKMHSMPPVSPRETYFPLLNLAGYTSPLQQAQRHHRFWDVLVSHALNPCGICRGCAT